MIKVAIDSGPITTDEKLRGIGIHTQELVKYLKSIRDLKVDVVDFKNTDLSGFDIIHYPKFNPYYISLPFKKIGKTIITIHDLIYLLYPKAYPSGIKGALKYWLQKILIRQVDAVITISETSKKDIIRLLGIPSESINVIYLAPLSVYRKINAQYQLLAIKRRYHLPEKFVLYVGDVNYNKNIYTLAKACKIAKTPLVIVGKQAVVGDFDRNHQENKPFADFLDKYGNDKEIIRLGYVPNEDMVVIYNLASVYCQPSFYEGFGLPLLEAFACGTPVVASKISAHMEIAGDSVLYVDPKDSGDMAEKITMMIKDDKLKQEYIKKGSAKVKKYSWDKTASETYKVYQKVLARV